MYVAEVIFLKPKYLVPLEPLIPLENASPRLSFKLECSLLYRIKVPHSNNA